MSSDTMEISGASAIPARIWQLRTSYGLSILRVESSGLAVVVRPVWLGRMMGALLLVPRAPELAPYAGWLVAWDDIDRVAATDRSLVVYPRGRRGCLFMVRRKAGFEPVLRELERRSIRMDRVRTNFFRSMFL